MQATRYVMVVLISGWLVGCVDINDKRGVEVTWQPGAVNQLQKGKSTRKDVLTLLGPPSQVINLGEESVLYYLYERSVAQGMILILYNTFDRDTEYDRAVFFFDANDVLTEYATHINVVPEEG